MHSYKPPFPYFGGKSRIAADVWQRFGKVKNFVDPFCGSNALLFLRPTIEGKETVNDSDGFIVNFFRATKSDPEAVAYWADWIVSESDMHARHHWLKEHRYNLTQRLEGDPEYFDAKIAGWWCWGICCWIGSGWCQEAGAGPWMVKQDDEDYPILVKEPKVKGISHQIPYLADAGRGVNRPGISHQIPYLWRERGVNRPSTHLSEYFQELAARLKYVRICAGDWERVLTPVVTTRLGLTAIFLDPPYKHDGRDTTIYHEDNPQLFEQVKEWAIANGDNPKLRIALCGYDDADLPGWSQFDWKTGGGYAKQGTNLNCHRERIWFNKHCALTIRA